MKKQNDDTFTLQRRNFLKTVAAAGISNALLRASPLIPGLMLSRMADAQSIPQKKAVIIFMPDGAIPSYWHPDSSLNFPVMSSPYSEIKGYCNFIDNVNGDSPKLGHGQTEVLLKTGFGAPGDSFDVNMGKILGANTPFKYLNVGVHATGDNPLSWDNGAKLPTEDNPFSTFKRLFSAPPSTGGDTKETSVLNAHKEALNAVKSKLGSYEQQRLDSHLTAISEAEKRLSTATSGGGGACGSPSAPAQFNIEYATADKQWDLQTTNIQLALQCGLIGAASITLSNHSPDLILPNLNFKGSIHNSIHGDYLAGHPYFSEVRSEMARYSVKFIKKLIAANLIDSTLVMEISDCGDGTSHDTKRVPVVLAGGSGLNLRRGVLTSAGDVHLHEILHTAAVGLGASSNALYRPIGSRVVSGVFN
jgi:hypothetical protein